mmetsp:Transcript_28180/g.81506  ORF Transcript_28180/g.81506 Transcript_28180/m.81506 type:complete len:930 (+) Transcript_28180:275-3064(+)|eukprot:CAMPEP_0181022494 /NCGR_PEP_ID=MMETSP1070-20121207/1542_1 /TAXON_ID=265543 /ORGANISM="Minutocellus polymorphus, Strain NH13" /LENGTH=929 /DNA_ID=CAMNT_0023099435 /DNA_START=266 /DNA_END=3055 /DNA_ORIENTATION=+
MLFMAFFAHHPAVRSLVYVVLTLVVVPFLLTSYLTSKTTSSYNVCFVGPAPLSTPHQHPDYAQHLIQREFLTDLYGMYRTFDRASYYYVKTPFDATPLCLTGHLWGCGWPSAVSVATTLSPRQVRHSKQGWRSSAKSNLIKAPGGLNFRKNRGDHQLYVPGYSMDGTGSVAGGGGSLSGHAADGDHSHQPAGLVTAQISWDRSPAGGAVGSSETSGGIGGMLSSYAFSESAPPPGDMNRWCLSSIHLREGGGTASGSTAQGGTGTIGMQSVGTLPSATASSTKIKICTEEVPSIVTDPSKPPYFNELPLGPPPDGIWAGLEEGGAHSSGGGGGGIRPDIVDKLEETLTSIADLMGHGGGRMNDEPIEAVEVQCYVQQSYQTISVAATGSVASGPMDEIKGLSQPATVTWNLLKLPGTMLIIILLLWRFWFLHYREDDEEEEASDIFSTRRSNSTRNLHFVSTIIRENALIPSRVRFPYPEFYRLVSSPIAHSSIVSLVFSVLGIYWMGATNEIDFGTIPFLSLNVSMAILSGLIALLLVKILSACTTRYYTGAAFGSDSLGPIAMGYSPVVFAWMVIASLERPTLHIPIPGLPLTVPTITILFFIPFNALIPVGLLIAKCMEGTGGRRNGTSFLLVGNVAGAIVGFFLYSGVFPANLLVPHLLIPIGLVVSQLICAISGAKKVKASEFTRCDKVGYGYADTANNDDTSAAATTGLEMGNGKGGNGRGHQDESEEDEAVSVLAVRPVSKTERNFLPLMRLLLLTTSLLSFSAFDHGLALGQTGVALLYHLGTSTRLSMETVTNDGSSGWSSIGKAQSSADRSLAARSIHMFRSTLLSLSIMVFADAMSAGSWVVSYIFITADQYVSYNTSAIAAFIGLRLFVNLLAMISVSALLGPRTGKSGKAINIGDECTNLLGPVFSWVKSLGEKIL